MDTGSHRCNQCLLGQELQNAGGLPLSRTISARIGDETSD
jgi:hypothetical protein